MSECLQKNKESGEASVRTSRQHGTRLGCPRPGREMRQDKSSTSSQARIATCQKCARAALAPATRLSSSDEPQRSSPLALLPAFGHAAFMCDRPRLQLLCPGPRRPSTHVVPHLRAAPVQQDNSTACRGEAQQPRAIGAQQSAGPGLLHSRSSSAHLFEAWRTPEGPCLMLDRRLIRIQMDKHR